MDRFFKTLLKTFLLTLLIVPSFTILYNSINIINSNDLTSQQNVSPKVQQDPSFFLRVDVNNTNPSPSQAVNVSSVIYNSNGIKNASLFWTYDSINSTLFNSPLNKNHETIDSQSSFPKTGYVFPNGTETNISQTEKFGEYTYYLNDSSYISNFGVNIGGAGGNTLVYAKIESLNSQGSTWNTIFEDGAINSTNSINSVNLNDLNISYGYKIYAVSYKKTNPSSPTLTVNLFKDYYSAEIPALYQPTKITYYLQAFNTIDNLSQTISYTIFMNSPLTILVNEVPTDVSTSTFYVNISITDPDGWNWIDQSSVKAYYAIDTQTSSNTQLVLDKNISLTTANFIGYIDVASLRSTQNKTLTLYFKAQVLLTGGSAPASSTNNFQVVLIGDPSLATSSSTPTSSSSSTQTSTSQSTNSNQPSGTQPGNTDSSTSSNQTPITNQSSNTSSNSSKNGKSSWNEIFTLFGLLSIGLFGLTKRRLNK